MTDEDRPARLSLDQIRAQIEGIAQDSENRDSFKALKMLASMESSAVILPPPMTGADVVDRLARLLRPAGVELSRRAFQRAFKKTHGQASIEAPPKGDPMDVLSDEDRRRVGRVMNLRDLYRVAPPLKRGGIPAGFPKLGDVLEKQEFCRAKAAEYLVAAQRNPVPPPAQPTEPTAPAA